LVFSNFMVALACAAVAHLHGDILLTAHRISGWRRHDVAARVDDREDLARVGRVHPQSAAAAALEHEIAAGGHDTAVIAAHAARSLVLPDDFLGRRIPGPDELAHQFHLALRLEILELRQRAVQALQTGRVIGVVGKDAVGREEALEKLQVAAIVHEVHPDAGCVDDRDIHEMCLAAQRHRIPGVSARP
jgi:hypothetical protein